MDLLVCLFEIRVEIYENRRRAIDLNCVKIEIRIRSQMISRIVVYMFCGTECTENKADIVCEDLMGKVKSDAV